MRLFTAIDPTDEVRNQLRSIQDESKLSVRWSPPEQFHVTIRFIGEVDEPQAHNYDAALESLNLAPVECEPYGFDVLPTRRSPRVLTLGLKRTDEIMDLYEGVSKALESEGLSPEDRKYKPHITVARLDPEDRDAVHEFLQNHKEESFPTFKADNLVLFESTLTPEGAIHEAFATYPLGD